jgi:hypothetical protein
MVAEAPSPKVGDIWRSQILDMPTKRVRSRSEFQILSFENDRWMHQSTNLDTGVKRVIPYSKQWGQCLSLLNSKDVVCGSYFSFPMQVGTKSGFKNQPWNNGKGHNSVDCETTSYEKVTVPAGTFDAFKVVCKGEWQQVVDGRGWGRFDETLWYSPAVTRNVRYETRSYSGGLIADWYMGELVEYVPAK